MSEADQSRKRERRRSVADASGSESGESRDAATWIAVVVLLVLGGGLLGLMALVTPHLLGVVLVLGGFVGFGALHYVLWGWWLKKSLTNAEPEDEVSSDREA